MILRSKRREIPPLSTSRRGPLNNVGMNDQPKWTIAHGTLGAPERNWFPWLTWQGVRAGVRVRVPRLPTPTGQSFDAWAREFDAQAGPIDERTVIIGHSTGVPFFLQYLQRTGRRAGAAFFVSGFAEPIEISAHPEMKPLLKTFVAFDFDFPQIRALLGSAACFHGDDDEIVPLAAGQRVADGLGCPLHVVKGGKHLNTEAGRFEFPELLAQIEFATARLRSDA